MNDLYDKVEGVLKRNNRRSPYGWMDVVDATREVIVGGITRSCDNCKYAPIRKHWPCIDCAVQYADRWEPKVSCDICKRDCPEWAKNIAESNGCVSYEPEVKSEGEIL